MTDFAMLKYFCVPTYLNKTGIPLLMEQFNGNNSDKDSFSQTIQNHIDQLRSNFKLE